MELMQLRYVAGLSSCCNYTKAANQLFISQPALSQQIAKLEHEFGFALFNRNSKNVSPTPEGEIIIPKIQKILAEIDELQRSVENINPAVSGSVRFGINLIDRSAIPKAIASFVQTFPSVQIHIQEAWADMLIDLVQRGELDAAITAHPVGDDLEKEYEIPGIDFDMLAQDHLVLAVNTEHRFVGRTQISLEEIIDETIIFPSERSNVCRQVMTRYKKLGIEPRHVIFLDSSPSLIDFILSGAGVSFISTHHAQKYAGKQMLVAIPIYPKLKRRSALITRSGTNTTPATKLLREYMLFKLREE